jgi:hypothetical protein
VACVGEGFLLTQQVSESLCGHFWASSRVLPLLTHLRLFRTPAGIAHSEQRFHGLSAERAPARRAAPADAGGLALRGVPWEGREPRRGLKGKCVLVPGCRPAPVISARAALRAELPRAWRRALPRESARLGRASSRPQVWMLRRAREA